VGICSQCFLSDKQNKVAFQRTMLLRARAEHGPRLRSPGPLSTRTPIVLVAVDTAHIDDERHPAIRLAVSQILALSQEYRLICLTSPRPRSPCSTIW